MNIILGLTIDELKTCVSALYNARIDSLDSYAYAEKLQKIEAYMQFKIDENEKVKK